jgi:transcription antitermination factor NusG
MFEGSRMNAIDRFDPAVAEVFTRTDDRSPSDLTFQPCGCRSGIPWFCFRTQHASEVLAEMELRTQGFCAWVPMEFQPRKYKQGIIRPLFLRYGFIQLDVAHDLWRRVFATKGVEWLFCTPLQRPIPVRDSEMTDLLSRAAPNGVIYPEEDEPAPIRRGWRPVWGLTDAERETWLHGLFGRQAA